MNYNGLYFSSRDLLCEDEYNLAAEANRAALHVELCGKKVMLEKGMSTGCEFAHDIRPSFAD